MAAWSFTNDIWNSNKASGILLALMWINFDSTSQDECRFSNAAGKVPETGCRICKGMFVQAQLLLHWKFNIFTALKAYIDIDKGSQMRIKLIFSHINSTHTNWLSNLIYHKTNHKYVAQLTTKKYTFRTIPFNIHPPPPRWWKFTL